MASFACLRVLTPANMASRLGLEALIDKFAKAFLDSRWAFPRRYEVLAAGAYLLVEPRGGRLDRLYLEDMATDLQLKLFGAEGEGEVTLVAFEGAAEEVARFAALSAQALEHLLGGGEHHPPFVGQITRVSPLDVVGAGPPTQSNAPTVEGRNLPPRVQDVDPVFYGVYFTPRERFVGCLVAAETERFNLQEGLRPADAQSAHEYDERSTAATVRALEILSGRSGLLFVPVCFGSIIHGIERDRHARFMEGLPAGRRAQTAAAVYDVPRQLTYRTIPILTDFLRRYFGTIDLQVSDPDFAVEALPHEGVNSVTFVVPDGDAKSRLAAIRRFGNRREAYKARRIWSAATNVRTHTELELCFALGIPFVTGRAVSSALDRPPHQPELAASRLPLRAA
ncbi:hypothetical protein ACO2Q3_00930 [Caulobacter sp. KR2-114]|uniref:hypothetical protein n=1 Tax=Caulobacter sp. KR2-114 TaxID=3400912 RepID=UPI003BFE3490